MTGTAIDRYNGFGETISHFRVLIISAAIWRRLRRFAILLLVFRKRPLKASRKGMGKSHRVGYDGGFQTVISNE